MAVILTDNRTIVHEMDSTTGVSSTTGAGTAVFTSQPNPVEATGSIGTDVSTSTENLYATLASIDHSAGTLIYVWALANGIMDSLVNGGIQLVIGDGSNRRGYHIAGSDVASFRYNTGEVAWQCLILDTANLPANFTQFGGGAVTLTALTDYGVAFKTLAKALGGTENCFLDIIRYGNGGLTVTGGGSGTEGTFGEISAGDRSNANQIAFGIIHEVASGVYGLQGALVFGDSVGTGSLDFLATDETAVFEDRNINTDKYSITVTGNATGATSFQLGTKVGVTGGSNGVSLSSPVGVGASFDASNSNIDFVKMYGGSLVNYDQGVIFSSDATNAPNHEVFSYSFSGCSQIQSGKINFKDNVISGTTDANGGYAINSNTDMTKVSGITFNSDGTGHAIYVTTTGTFSITEFNFSGYGADGTTDATIYNNSGGAVTLNITGGSGAITVRNGAGASTTINNAVTLEITVLDNETGLPIATTARVQMAKDSDNSSIMSQAVDVNGVATLSYNLLGDTPFHGWVREFSLTGTDYVQKDISGTITSNGYVATVRLIPVT